MIVNLIALFVGIAVGALAYELWHRALPGRQANALYIHGANPGGITEVDGALGPEAAEAIRRDWVARHRTAR